MAQVMKIVFAMLRSREWQSERKSSRDVKASDSYF